MPVICKPVPRHVQSSDSVVAPPTGGRLNGHSRPERRPELAGYDSSSTLMSSELDTTSFFDSEEDDSASR